LVFAASLLDVLQLKVLVCSLVVSLVKVLIIVDWHRKWKRSAEQLKRMIF